MARLDEISLAQKNYPGTARAVKTLPRVATVAANKQTTQWLKLPIQQTALL